MEKVIAVSGVNDLGDYEMKEINTQLERGWKVKSVTTAATKDYVTAIFVLTNE